MSEQSQQTEPVAANGEPVVKPVSTGDTDFDAALAEASKLETPAEPEPVSEPVAEPAPPAAPQDFTFTSLQNGERELRLATGEVYRGKDDNAIIAEIAKGKLEANRYIQTLKQTPPTPTAPTPQPTPEPPDPTAMALADLMAPAFGVKSGKELIGLFNEMQLTATLQQEMVQRATIQGEVQKFVAAVPQFSKLEADGNKIDAYLNEIGVEGNAKTWEMAYHTLAAKGELSAPSAQPSNVIRMPDGRFAPAPKSQAPVNNMPPPPVGTAPAATGKGQTTEADLWNMTSDQLEALLQEQSAKSA